MELAEGLPPRPLITDFRGPFPPISILRSLSGCIGRKVSTISTRFQRRGSLNANRVHRLAPDSNKNCPTDHFRVGYTLHIVSMQEFTPANFNPHTGLWYYRKIDRIDDERQTIADGAPTFFANDLEMDAPIVTWIFPEPWEGAEREEQAARARQEASGEPYECNFVHETVPLLGHIPFEFDNRIFILGELDVLLLIRTIAHEMRHVWQEKQYGSQWHRQNAEVAAEEDADRYAFEAMQRYPEYLRLSEDLAPIWDELRQELEK
jgi:hypothetical protein